MEHITLCGNSTQFHGSLGEMYIIYFWCGIMHVYLHPRFPSSECAHTHNDLYEFSSPRSSANTQSEWTSSQMSNQVAQVIRGLAWLSEDMTDSYKVVEQELKLASSELQSSALTNWAIWLDSWLLFLWVWVFALGLDLKIHCIS